MVRGADELGARRRARERVARKHEKEREREEKVAALARSAAQSAAAVEHARREASQAEELLAQALQQHEERMALIVAAFRGESVGIQSIAELLDTSPTQVRRWNRAARRGAAQADPVDTAQPSLTGEQEPPAPDDVA